MFRLTRDLYSEVIGREGERALGTSRIVVVHRTSEGCVEESRGGSESEGRLCRDVVQGDSIRVGGECDSSVMCLNTYSELAFEE